MGEDRLLQAPQRLARLDPQLLDERPSSVLVDVERLRLTAATVEGEHELPAQTLLQWVLSDKRLELPDEVDVPAERQVDVDPLDQRAQAKLLEPTDLTLGERLVGELGERRAAPHRERFVQQRDARSGSPAACAVRPSASRCLNRSTSSSSGPTRSE